MSHNLIGVLLLGVWIVGGATITVLMFALDIRDEKDLSDPDVFMPNILIGILWPVMAVLCAGFGVVYGVFYFLPVQAARLVVKIVSSRATYQPEIKTAPKEPANLRPGMWME